MITLFSSEKTKTILTDALQRLSNITQSDSFESQRNATIFKVIKAILTEPEKWDEHCQTNIEFIGQAFIADLLDMSDKTSSDELDEICSSCFRFLMEYDLSSHNQLQNNLNLAKSFVLENLPRFSDIAKEQINFANRDMPSLILKSIMNSEGISSIKEFNILCKTAIDLKNEWETELSNKEKRINELRDSLAAYENGFNFVGLYQGFDDLSKDKVNEKNNIVFWLRVLSLCIIAPILLELAIILLNIENISSLRNGLIAALIPSASLIAISIYYFRVMLSNYRSVKSQLLQIELRKTLCRFIQQYASYSKELKTQDPESLNKFEQIIFSGIVSNEGDLPSAYDGLDQITKLFQAIRK